MYDEVTIQKDNIFLSLTNQEDQPAIIKKKRGLVKIIGKVMNTLFGVCDDICVEKHKMPLEELKKVEIA